MTSPFQPLQFALILRNQAGDKINGTGSSYDLEATRTFASMLLQMMPETLFIDIHAYSNGVCVSTPVDTVQRKEALPSK